MNTPTSRAVIVVTMDVDPEYEAELNRWYDEEHVPNLLSCPGILGVRRFKARGSAGSYLAIAELAQALDTGQPVPQGEQSLPAEPRGAQLVQ